jgi:hypothetical protein
MEIHTYKSENRIRLISLIGPSLIMAPLMGDKQLIGKISHYFTNIGVAVIELEAPLSVGETISIEGATTDITQPVDSMQIDRKEVTKATKGQSIGLKVKDRVRGGDNVYKIA